MTREVAEVLANLRSAQSTPVFLLEDGQVWFSGSNANVNFLVWRASHALESEGYECGPTRSGGAGRHPGVILPVDGCTAISDEDHQEVTAHASG